MKKGQRGRRVRKEEQMAEILLRYDSVEVCYNGRPAAEEISFTLRPGEILGIAGESGSGKSTIIRAAMGLLGRNGMVTRGDIWFQGKNLPDLSRKEMEKIRGAGIGMVFQDAAASFCPVRTIGSQLGDVMAAHGRAGKNRWEERALELLEKLGLPDGRKILDSYPFQLSGGMNQRVGIAAAMLLNPAVLLADEPTSALDVTVQKQAVEEMLLTRQLYGTAIIIVSHNMGVISAMADSVLILKEGRMVEYGPARQVLERPREAYTRELLAAVPGWERGRKDGR